MKRNIAAVIPAYNEERTIAQVVDEVKKYVDIVIVVDDCSTDQTIKEAKGDKVILLRHMMNLGQGAALQTGFDYAKINGIEIVVTFDSDGQFLASEIPSVVKPLLKNNVDIVLGSRFLGKAIDMPLLRKVILKYGIIFTYLFSGVKLSDTHNGFRALSKKALSEIEITHNRMAHASEIIDEIIRKNLRYIEVPVTVRYDVYSKMKGQTNINSLKIVAQLITQKMY
jgi:glycosyltransferase involved in cell wall biosynthesis